MSSSSVRARRTLSAALLTLAAAFLAWELYGAVRWVRSAGGLGNAFDHLWQAITSDWMALIVVTDHLLIAGVVLVALWLDALRCGWPVARRLLLAAAFVALGSPALLAYLAWRVRGVAAR